MNLGPLLFLIIVAVIIIVAVRRSQDAAARRPRSYGQFAHLPQPERIELGHNPAAPPVLAQWDVQMHETARTLAGELDSKMSALQQLIHEADRAAARLEAALARVPPAPIRAPAMPAVDAAAAAPAAEPPPLPATQAEKLTSFAELQPVQPSSTAPSSEAATANAREDRYDEIYMLSDYGFDVAEIARRTELPVGEVQLILSLRSQR